METATQLNNGGEHVTDSTAPDVPVLRDRRGNVLVLTLNRPDRLNAWTDKLEDQYFALLDEADADPEVRAIVVTGAGRGFCAGADMDDLKLAGEIDTATLPKRVLPRHHPLSFRKPLIAAINGAAAGLGLVEAIFCDVRFAVPDAKFTTSFSRRGLIAEYGVAWLLPRIVGTSRALDLLMSARVISCEEAHRIGLVDFLAEPADLLDRAVAYAQDLASFCSPTSMSIIKSQVFEAIDGDFGAAVERADSAMLESFGGADVREGVSSYLERRPPQFPPLAPRGETARNSQSGSLHAF
jgi:enoyl-CoA hydratase/carnithine racemase